MKAFLRSVLARWHRALAPKPNPALLEGENQHLKDALQRLTDDRIRQQRLAEMSERISELAEARMMAGVGPWRVSAAVLEDTDRFLDLAASALQAAERGVPLRETAPIVAAGATGDIELALQNVEWRREINLSWLEFSRWGIQQIILISRLYYIKHPWLQRGLNLVSQYVFGRGFEVSSEDDKTNDAIQDFLRLNKKTLGQKALMNAQNQLGYDGQVFFALFSDTIDSGAVQVRTIDATEIFEIVTNPEDTDDPWLYHRKWTQIGFRPDGQRVASKSCEAYYPALGWQPDAASGFAGQPPDIGGVPVFWKVPVHHMKGGTGVAKWHFDTPKLFAALDWARNGRRLLEADMTTHIAMAQIALTISTKGGQQALEGAKVAMGTTVGPTSNLWDMNPPAITGSTFASGPGTDISAFKTRGMGGDPSEVKEYRNMVACVLEIPPTFLADMETSNLATATSLDRPTELAMMAKQEVWRECLITLTTYALTVSMNAASGKLRESKKRRIVECSRRYLGDGTWVYEAKQGVAAEDIEIKVTFPAIREGDQNANVTAISTAMTLGNTQGQVVGIDEKTGVLLLMRELGVENAEEILDKMYPKKIFGTPGKPGYDPNRTAPPPEPPKPPVPAVPVNPSVEPPKPVEPAPAKAQEAARRLLAAVKAIGNGRELRH